MEWIPVRSKAISRVAYHLGELYIDWKQEGGGDIYAYSAPPSILKRLLNAPSIGAFANDIVKKTYPARKVGFI